MDALGGLRSSPFRAGRKIIHRKVRGWQQSSTKHLASNTEVGRVSESSPLAFPEETPPEGQVKGRYHVQGIEA